MKPKQEVPTPLDKERLDWTGTFARPEASWWTSPIKLDYAQSEWDQAEAQRQKHVAAVEGFRVRREAREAEQRQVRETAEQEERERRDAALVADLRRKYLGSDPTATEADFQAALPQLREDRRRRMTLEDDPVDVAARNAMRRQYLG